MGHPRPLFPLFSSFQTNITIFTTNKCEKYPSRIRRWDLNPQPLEQESHPMTTRSFLDILIMYLPKWAATNTKNTISVEQRWRTRARTRRGTVARKRTPSSSNWESCCRFQPPSRRSSTRPPWSGWPQATSGWDKCFRKVRSHFVIYIEKPFLMALSSSPSFRSFQF